MKNRRITFVMIISLAAAAEYARYNFAQDLGEHFRDYSGNGYHGTNGDSHLDDTLNVQSQQIHRGLYFDGTTYGYAKWPSATVSSLSYNLNNNLSNYQILVFLYVVDNGVTTDPRTLFDLWSDTWQDLQVNFNYQGWNVNCAKEPGQISWNNWGHWDQAESSFGTDGWYFMRWIVTYEGDRPTFEWRVNETVRGKKDQGAAADFVHTGANPYLKIGTGWKGFIAHLVILLPPYPSMYTYYIDLTVSCPNVCWVMPAEVEPGACLDIDQSYDCAANWSCASGTQWHRDPTDWEPCSHCPTACSYCEYDYGADSFECFMLDGTLSTADVGGVETCQCSAGYYFQADASVLPANYWFACDPSCATWDGAGANCLSWGTGQFMQPDVSTSKTCSPTWPEQYFEDTSNNECTACASPCRTCGSAAADDCIYCMDINAIAVLGSCYWNLGFYDIDSGDDVDWQACSPECSTCWGSLANQCGSWVDPNAVTDSSQQWQCNSVGYFDSDPLQGQICTPCFAACLTWSGPDQDHWTGNSCYDINAVLSSDPGECLCQPGYYDADASDVQQCITCDHAWDGWTGPGASNCVNWAAGYHLNMIWTWIACSIDCATCTTPADTDCTSCFDSNASVILGRWTCNQGYFDADPGQIQACGSCFSACQTCTGADNVDWTSCIDINAASANPGECEWQHGWYDSDPSDGVTCAACDIGWDGWVGTVTDCLAWVQGFYFIIGSWFACSPECSGCTGAADTACTSCFDTNASVVTGTWTWNSNFFDSDNAQTQNCVQCFDACATCSGANKEDWTSCQDPYATSDNTGECLWQLGWYDSDSGDGVSCTACNSAWTDWYGPGDSDCTSWASSFILNGTTWSQCSPEWSGCTGALDTECTSCRDSNASVVTGRWTCNPKYIDIDPAQAQKCVQCFETCATCSGANKEDCTSCVDLFAVSANPGEWQWKLGWYDGNVGDWVSCLACDSVWIGWYDAGESNCISWVAGMYKNSLTGKCESCDPSWATWTGPTNDECIDWQTSHYKQPPTATSSQCRTTCPLNSFENGLECTQCFSSCRTWTGINKSQCTSCMDQNAQAGSPSEWTCKEGWHDSDLGDDVNCVHNQPITTISVTEDNNVLITFSEEISRELQKQDIILEVSGPREDGYEYDWELVEQDQFKKYMITISFEHDDIPKGTTLRVKIDSDLTGVDEDDTNASLDIELNEEESSSQYTDQEIQEADSLEEIVSITATSAVNSAFVVAVFTGDMTSGWNFVNALQIISFIPMLKTELPLQLNEMLKGLLEIEIIPNIFEFILDEDDFTGEKPFKKANEYGFDHAVFLINGGSMLTQTIVLLLFLPVAFMFAKCKNQQISYYFNDFVQSYKWGFFIRAWLEMYLELLLAAFIQIKAPSYNNMALSINTILAYTFLSMMCLTPIILPVFLVAQRRKLINPPPLFAKIYGSLFTEFKNDNGLMSSFYYPVFIIRRAIYVLNIVLIADYIWESFCINIIFSLLNLFFLIYFRPYLSRLTNFISVLTEIAIGALFALCTSFQYNYDDDMERKVMWTGVSLIYFIFAINMFDILYTQAAWVIDVWKKKTTQSMIKSAKINPVTQTENSPKADPKHLHGETELQNETQGDIQITSLDEDRLQDGIIQSPTQLPNINYKSSDDILTGDPHSSLQGLPKSKNPEQYFRRLSLPVIQPPSKAIFEAHKKL